MKGITRVEFEKENVNNDYVDFCNKLKPRIEFENFTDEEIKIIKSRHEELLQIVHEEVVKYIDKCSSTGIDGNDWFPCQARLTGKYYIGDEYYCKRENGGIFAVIMARFTTMSDYFMIEDGIMKKREYKDENEERIFEEIDYLGLSVEITSDTVKGEFDEVDAIDSSSI